MRTYLRSSRWGARARAWAEANAKLRRSIVSDLRRRGPLRTRDLADLAVEGWRSSGWTADRNVDRMLDLLWTTGRVLVADRRGLEKWWDVAERVLPAEVRGARLSDRAVTQRAAELSLRALGIGTAAHIKRHFTEDRYPDLPRVLARFEREGRIERVRVLDDHAELRGPWFVHREDLALLERIGRGRWEPRSTLLSPFDNLIRDRRRTLELFGMDYKMEIYVPKSARRYGYYAMPLLDGERFIARVDSAADRGRRRLVVHAVTPEVGVRPARTNAAVVAGAVHELAAWTGAEGVEVGERVPSVWRREL
jgi:hypothetical protein